VSQIVRFAGYSSPEHGHDAALLKLATALDLSGPNAKAIGVVTAADSADGAGVAATVTGWGTTSSGSNSTPDGLRSVVVNLLSNSALAQQYGSRPADLVVAIGPSIGACCYEVGLDVRDAIARAGFDDRELASCFFAHPQPTARNPSMLSLSRTRRADHWFFDGLLITCRQLERAGVPQDRIYTSGLCTASHPDLFCSYRRDGSPAGRMAAAIRSRPLG